MINFNTIDKSSKFVNSIFKMHNKVFRKTVLERVHSKSGKAFKKKKGFEKSVIQGINVFSKYNDDAICDMIYLHGGAYVIGLNITHFMFVNQTSKEINANFHVIDYPLAPISTVINTVNKTIEVIKEIKSNAKTKYLYVFGDSAGGGLALSVSSQLENDYFDGMFLFSPWVNIKMDHPDTQSYQLSDMVLAIDNLIHCGELYTGNNLEEKLASPKYLQPHTKLLQVYVGDQEVFYPDIVEYEQKHPITNLEIFIGGAHGFPLFPFTKDQKIVIHQITEAIKNHQQ